MSSSNPSFLPTISFLSLNRSSYHFFSVYGRAILPHRQGPGESALRVGHSVREPVHPRVRGRHRPPDAGGRDGQPLAQLQPPDALRHPRDADQVIVGVVIIHRSNNTPPLPTCCTKSHTEQGGNPIKKNYTTEYLNVSLLFNKNE